MVKDDFVEVNERLQILLRHVVRRFPKLDLEIIFELVEAGENMIALEMLAGALAENHLSISSESHWEIVQLAEIMRLESPRLQGNIAILDGLKLS